MSNLQLRNACDQFIHGALRSYVTLACMRNIEPYRSGTQTLSVGGVEVIISNFTGIRGNITRIQVTILKDGVPVIDIPEISEHAVWYQLVDACAITEIVELLEIVELMIRVYHPLK